MKRKLSTAEKTAALNGLKTVIAAGEIRERKRDDSLISKTIPPERFNAALLYFHHKGLLR